ncbi:MAG: histidinol dehydrogenase, partial [Desulfotomaculales bacterium]
MDRIISVIFSGDPSLDRIMERKAFFRKEAAARVEEIVAAVQKEGDAALCRFSREFDGVELNPEELPVTQEEIRAAYRQVGEDFLSALTLARERITSFHQKQLARSWFETDQQGVFRGQVV